MNRDKDPLIENLELEVGGMVVKVCQGITGVQEITDHVLWGYFIFRKKTHDGFVEKMLCKWSFTSLHVG